LFAGPAFSHLQVSHRGELLQYGACALAQALKARWPLRASDYVQVSLANLELLISTDWRLLVMEAKVLELPN
jgi:hypothetical protein